MRIHQFVSLQYTNQGQLNGIHDIQLYDVNHALSPFLTQEDCINFFFQIGNLLTPGPGVNRWNRPDNQPVGFSLNQFVGRVNYHVYLEFLY